VAERDGVVVAAVDGRIVAASPIHQFHEQLRQFTFLFPPGVVGTGELRFALLTGNEGIELEASG